MKKASQTLGRLERVDLRSIWSSESDDFTPWLAGEENLRLLGEAIGIDLQLEATEKNVGPFRADILCKDAFTDHWVLIENQLERTNHVHLGQIITYAAGLGAVTIVWIAAAFTEEHRAALDWLNEATGKDINFVGLEVELWKIGESYAAPKFNIVCQPNEWTREISSATGAVDHAELSESKKTQLRFWKGFYDFVLQSGSVLKPTQPRPSHVMRVYPDQQGYGLAAVASMWNSETESYEAQEIRADFWFMGTDTVEIFESLESMKSNIERGVNDKFVWHAASGDSTSRRVYIRKTVDLYNDANWPNEYPWLLEKLELLNSRLGPQVQEYRRVG